MKLREFRWRTVMRRLMTLLAAGFAGSLLAYPLAGIARVDVDVTIAPPAAVVEDVPARPGYIYAPGYWDWDADHHRHVWKKGEYMKERHGERYVPYAWSEHEGHYRLNPGHWERSDHGS
jgi:hypothetical protein